MKKKEAIQWVNQHVTDFFSDEGYKPFETPYTAGWCKKNDNGDLYFLDLSYISRISIYTGKKDSFQIEPSVVIHIKEIEDYYKQVTTRQIKYDVDCRTFSVWVASIRAFPNGIVHGIGHNRFDWVAHKREDIEAISKPLIKSIREIAMPYIAENANVPRVDKLFNDNLEQTVIHCASDPDRFMRGLIAGKLVGRKNMNELMAYYDNVMAQTAPKLQSEYATLKALLPEIKQKYSSLAY